MEEILKVNNLFAGYKKKNVLNGVSFSEKKGEKILLIGPNGSGKSTLIKTIIGLVKPEKGEIFFKNEKINNLPTYKIINKGIGYLSQTKNVFPSLTLYENVKIAFWNKENKEIEEILNKFFEIFPFLSAYKNKRAGLLSGGERQALAIGIVLLQEKDLYLLDEPTAGLSPMAAENILEGIKKMTSNNLKSIILVEHNIRYVQDWYEKLIIMKEGKILIKEENLKGIPLKNILEEVYF